jgi:hypothetical protein
MYTVKKDHERGTIGVADQGAGRKLLSVVGSVVWTSATVERHPAGDTLDKNA